MASFAACLDKAVEARKISREKADEMLAESQEVGIDAAIQSEKIEIAQSKRDAINKAIKSQKLNEMAESHPKGYGAGLLALIHRDATGLSKYTNVEKLSQTLANRYHAQVADMLSKFRTRKLGLTQDVEGLQNFVRALFGEQVDGEISQLAKQYKALLDEMVDNFNKAGGSLRKLDSYHLPQSHNRRLVTAADDDEWINFVMPLLDRSKMVDIYGRVLTDAELVDALKFSKKTIETEGLNKIPDLEPLPRGIGKKLAKKHSEKRFLHFKDAEGWLTYHSKFGANDIFASINNHIEIMSHDTAMMQMFGPNPSEMFDTLLRQAQKNGVSDSMQVKARRRWDTVTGAVNDKGSEAFADAAQGMRNWISASLLPKAIISAMSDTSFSALTSVYNGISVPFMKQIALMSSEEMQTFATKLGLGADSWTGMAVSANRLGETYGVGWSAKVSEAVMRGQGMSVWTQSGRHAFGMELLGAMADHAGKTFDDLPERFRKALERYDINGDDWNKFRRTKKQVYKGIKYLDLKLDEGGKFSRMALTEMDYAVPSPGVIERSYQTMGLKAGTVEGEVTRSLMQFKSFPITMLTTHFMRMVHQNGLQNQIAYGSALVLSTTMMGALAMMGKDIAAGREPRMPGDDVNSQGKFWAAALTQGGGLGILGDLFFSDVNRFGGGPIQSMIGPSASMIDDVFKLTVGNVQELIAGDDMKLSQEIGDFVNRYTPDLIWTKPITDGIVDQAVLWADPKAQQRFNRQMRKRKREYDQEYWWKRGQFLPGG